MTIIFISYWGINDGLTASTVLPHVSLLASFEKVKKIFLCSIERSQFQPVTLNDKIEHIPLVSKYPRNVIANKFYDFVFFPRTLRQLANKQTVDLVICRGSLAGAIGYRVSRQTKIPFIVESFEPHAAYMAESGVWPRYGLRFMIQSAFQNIISRSAKYILPVAHNYANELKKNGVEETRIQVVPCVVDLKKFQRDDRVKSRERLKLKIGQTVGIYVGKFGGLYYDDEAFQIFKEADRVFEHFFLIILTPDAKDSVLKKLLAIGFEESRFIVKQAPHHEVPAYMAAADFAFATYKKSYSKRYLSPIKIGEYWACGLPVFLTEGVGDDADIIEHYQCGATFSLEKNNVAERLLKIKHQLSDPNSPARNLELATKFRNPALLEKAYRTIINA